MSLDSLKSFRQKKAIFFYLNLLIVNSTLIFLGSFKLLLTQYYCLIAKLFILILILFT